MTSRRALLGAWPLVVAAVLAGTLLAGSAAAQPESYSAAPIRGRVVDGETKQPLEGVHVVAQWILDTGLFFHSERVERLHILETVTDAAGEYSFPGWGPKPRPPLARLDVVDPRLTFFKPGYRPLDRSNKDPHDRPLRTSRWDGQTIELEPFRGTPEEWALAISNVQSALAWAEPRAAVPHRINDHWKHYPRIVLAILGARQILPERVRYVVQDLRIWAVTEEEVRAASAQKRGAQ